METVKTWKFSCTCGSDERIAQEAVDAEKAAGRIPEAISMGAINVIDTPITDPSKQPKFGDRVPVLLRFTDICSKCGLLYIFRVEWQVHQVTRNVSNLIQPPPAGFPPFGIPPKQTLRGN